MSKEFNRITDKTDFKGLYEKQQKAYKEALANSRSLSAEYKEQSASLDTTRQYMKASGMSDKEIENNTYYQEQAQYVDKLAEELQKAESRASGLGHAIAGSYQNMNGIDKAKVNISSFTEKIGNAFKTIGSKAYEVAKSGIGAIGEKLKGLIPVIGKNKSSLSDMGSSGVGIFKKMALAMVGVRSVFMAMRKVASQIKSDNAEIGAQIDSIWKGIANALAPIVKKVMSYVGILMGYVNAIYKSFTGKDLFKSSAKSSSTAVKNAKELKRTLASFDEMNTLSDNSSDSDSSGSSDASYTTPVTVDMTDFAEKIKKAIENQDWKQVGQLIGDKVNEAIDSIDWKNVGTTIGKGLNGAIQIAYFTLDTIDFTQIGTDLATMVNGIFEQIDFEYVGRLWIKGFEIIPDMLIGFLGGLDWGLMAESLSNGLIGMFDEVTDWLKKYDWGKMADDCYKNIKEFLSKIKWGKLAQSLFTEIGTAFGSIGSFIITFLMDAFDDVVDYFKPYINDAGGNIVEGLFNGIKDAIVNVATFVRENIVDPFMEAVKDSFGIHSPSKKMEEIGVFLIDGLVNGVKNVGTKIKEKFDDAVGKIKESFNKLPTFFSGLWDKIKKTFSSLGTKLGNAIGSAVKSALNSVITMIEDTLNSGIKTINGAIKWINKLPNVNIKKFSEVSLPRFATGGIVNRPTQAIIGEAGAEAVVPLERNTQWLDKLADMLNEKISVSDDGTMASITINLDGERIYSNQQKISKRHSLVMNGG